jgi:ferrochelatase
MSAKGLLLINLGSPRSPEKKDVAAYLRQFLTDRFVIDIPAVFRQLLVRGVIVPLRAANSAAAYKKIWTSQGSPLVTYTREFADAVARSLEENYDVRWAMRYGEPSLKQTLRGWNVDELYIVPLYPQYAESSTRTALDCAMKLVDKTKKVYVLNDFHTQSEFVIAQAARIAALLPSFRPDHVLLSFHGLPEHHLTKLYPDHCLKTENCCAKVTDRNRDCYRAQAFATAAALCTRLPLPAGKTTVTFQSRLGRRPWIKPYTDHVVTELAKNGVKRLLVSCPSFVADCLETLEEVQIRLKEQFLSEGGEDLMLVPALNADADWVRAFSAMVQRVEWKGV